jgi:hypothetical protein
VIGKLKVMAELRPFAFLTQSAGTLVNQIEGAGGYTHTTVQCRGAKNENKYKKCGILTASSFHSFQCKLRSHEI